LYQIALCDDEVKILEDMLNKVKEGFSKCDAAAEYYATEDAEALLQHIRKNNIDILFLDIDMPKYNGMEIAEYLLKENSKTLLVFVTNYEALVYKSFQYQPFGFIRKNYFEDEITEVIERALKALKDKKESLPIKVNNEIIKVNICDIKYFEGDCNYVNLYGVEEQYRFRETLGNLEKELSSKDFIRIHKGYLVNQQFIHRIKGNEVQLSDGTIIPVGRSYSDSVKRKIMEAMRG